MRNRAAEHNTTQVAAKGEKDYKDQWEGLWRRQDNLFKMEAPN